MNDLWKKCRNIKRHRRVTGAPRCHVKSWAPCGLPAGLPSFYSLRDEQVNVSFYHYTTATTDTTRKSQIWMIQVEQVYGS
ncbi:hypothetical protein J6590_029464 [Homalodisca vitripennis]|nr:hypothetical protein J6590_029464 [Homalodisca vitripennis]